MKFVSSLGTGTDIDSDGYRNEPRERIVNLEVALLHRPVATVYQLGQPTLQSGLGSVMTLASLNFKLRLVHGYRVNQLEREDRLSKLLFCMAARLEKSFYGRRDHWPFA
jgi:hypothetical protein